MTSPEKQNKKRRRNRMPPGTPPGTLAPQNPSLPTIVRVMGYDENRLEERVVSSIDEIVALKDSFPVLWVDCDGFGNTDLIQKIADLLSLHPLAIEDAVNMDQRAKFDDFEQSLFLVCYRPLLNGLEMVPEQLSIFLGQNFVVTIQDHHAHDSFEVVRERLRKGVGRRLRRSGADYLAYTLMDYIIDSAFPVLECFGDQLDEMEDKVLLSPNPAVVADIHKMKRSLHAVRRAVWPLRDALASFISGHALIKDETRFYLRDCFDHTLQIIDIVETYRERASGLMDLYLTSQNNRMNEIMKVLTIIATIFMPLSFIASVYGMNFNTDYPANMPELNMPYGYLSVMVLMGMIVFFMLIAFWRRGWFR